MDGLLKIELDRDSGLFLVGYGKGSSPSFTNLTVTGTALFANGTAAAPSISFASDPATGFYISGANSISIALAGTNYGSITGLGSGIKLNGTGTNFLSLPSTGAVALTAGGTNQNITLTPSGTGAVTIASNLTVSGTGASPFTGYIKFASTNIGSGSETWIGSTGSLGGIAFNVPTGGLFTFAVNNVGMANWNSSGNLLFGTTTDSANGKIQLATHTTSAGGIGFGTDVALYRSAANEISIYTNGGLSHTFSNNGTYSQLTFRTLAGKIVNLQQISAQFGVNLVIGGGGGSNEDSTLQTGGTGTLYLKTGSSPTTAVSIDSSQNTTFAGIIIHKSYTVATLPAAAAGNTYGIVFVSDATNAAGTGIGTAPTGGGAVKRAVYSTGAAWLLL